MAASIPVVVNHGRWLVSCPFCNGAQLARPSEPFFICVGCRNEQTDGRPIPVDWPENYLEIDAVLIERPELATRNWFPHETVMDLRRENAQKGL